MKVCFTNPATGKKVCFYIPILVRRWPPINPLGLDDLKAGPIPEPWLFGDGIRPEAAHDLQALASIHVLADSLSKGSKQAVQDVLQKQIGSIPLPEGLKVDFSR